MNKADPNAAIDAFQSGARSAHSDWSAIDAALVPLGLAIRRRAASDAFLALAVTWEAFISTWLVAAVNKDTSKAIARVSKKLREHALDELRLPAGAIAGTLVTTSHLNLTNVRDLLDPKGWNVVIRTQKELGRFADDWLAGDYESRAAAISGYQYAPALIVRLIRNALAHQSQGAIDEANAAVRLKTIPVVLRYSGKRSLGVAGWGRYLLASSVPVPRIASLYTELIALAERLRV